MVREETCCHHYMGYSFQLAARDLLYAPSHREDSPYHGFSYTSCVALAGTRNILNVWKNAWGNVNKGTWLFYLCITVDVLVSADLLCLLCRNK